MFGTVELLSTAVAGLATLGTRIVVATGRVPPEDLGDVPDNVRVHSWVAQAAAAWCGRGRAPWRQRHDLAALAAGVPQVILPQCADQFANAEAVAGAALQLLPDEVSADAVADHALTLLSPSRGAAYRDAAEVIAREIAGMPSPDEFARRLPEYAGIG